MHPSNYRLLGFVTLSITISGEYKNITALTKRRLRSTNDTFFERFMPIINLTKNRREVKVNSFLKFHARGTLTDLIFLQNWLCWKIYIYSIETLSNLIQKPTSTEKWVIVSCSRLTGLKLTRLETNIIPVFTSLSMESGLLCTWIVGHFLPT
jgi:hypothetical protein